MHTINFKALLLVAVAGIASSLHTVSLADDSGQHKVVNGVAIYLGVMPAEMIMGHPKPHIEAEMHGGVPTSGNHQYHVLVALFDSTTGKRITNVKVKANVSKIGYAGVQKKLEPMLISGKISYGNYFKMAGSGAGPYRIRVQIQLHGVPGIIKAQFEHWHPLS